MAATQQAVIALQLQGATRVNAGLNNVQGGLNGVENAGKKANKMFRGMRGGTAQLGYQIQDIAVQLQGGQNALLVFGQQGSQLASIMGPGGALIGAFIAVAAAIGSTFIKSMEVGKVSIEELGAEIEKQVDKLGTINSEFAEFYALQNQNSLDESAKRFKVLSEEYEDGQEKLARLNHLLNQNIEAGKRAGQTAEFTTKNNRFLTDAIKEQSDANVVARAELALLEGKLKGVVKFDKAAADQRVKSAGRIIEAASKEFDVLVKQDKLTKVREKATMKFRLTKLKILQNENDREMTALIEADKAKDELVKKEMKRLNDVMKEEEKVQAEKDRARQDLAGVQFFLGTTEEQLEMQAAARQAIIETALENEVISKEQQQALLLQNEANFQQAMKASALMQQQQQLSSLQNTVNQMAAFADKGTAIGKAMFVAQKALAMAQAFIHYEVAIANAANQMGVFGIPLQAIFRAQQVAAMAMIAGQTVAGFEGGGITFNGVRSGGMDGRGGRMAVVHPNEKITDMEKNGGMGAAPVNVTMNISAVDAKGIDKLLTERRGLITGMVNKAINNQGRSSI
jgi:hypothetical protein